MRSKIKNLLPGLFLVLFLLACNLSSRTPNAASTLQAVFTSQAGTVRVLQTQVSRAGISTPLPSLVPTLLHPTVSPTFTLVPSIQPTATYKPTVTKSPTPSPTIVTFCDWAAFVKDVSIPDGTIILPGTSFTKIWRLKNIGTCTWTKSYGIVFLKGNNMNGLATTKLPSKVSPGQSVDISIVLSAPLSVGSQRGYWLLRNSSGETFGLGGGASDPFYVDIKVLGTKTTVLDFSENFCDAIWRSGKGVVDCSDGSNKSNDVLVSKIDNVKLENGQVYHGVGLLTAPEKGGYLQGYYPPITIRKGDRFRAIINCEYLADGCHGLFRLDYQIKKGPVKTIWTYEEAYEGDYHTVNTDLSSLAGKSVKFILTVLSKGSAGNDRLIWAGPRVERLTSTEMPPD